MADWRSLIDLDALALWMDALDLGGGAIEHASLLGGGTQNILLRFTRGKRDYVLRRPPAHPRPESNETMRREARILQALGHTRVPHPILIASCGDDAPLGTAFYLMKPVDGVNVADSTDAVHRAPEVQRRMGLAMVEAAADLGQLDPAALGLDGFGRTENYLARQPDRWRRQLESYATLDGWPGAAHLPGVEAVGKWLARHCPEQFVPGVIHGDFHIGNMLFSPDDGELVAIVDWELSTIGDPLVDLGWMIATWGGDDGSAPIVNVSPWSGFATSDELVDHYARHSFRELAAIDWYIVLACYKLGIILEGTYARACAGLADDATGASLHASAIRLFERATLRSGV